MARLESGHKVEVEIKLYTSGSQLETLYPQGRRWQWPPVKVKVKLYTRVKLILNILKAPTVKLDMTPKIDQGEREASRGQGETERQSKSRWNGTPMKVRVKVDNNKSQDEGTILCIWLWTKHMRSKIKFWLQVKVCSCTMGRWHRLRFGLQISQSDLYDLDHKKCHFGKL